VSALSAIGSSLPTGTQPNVPDRGFSQMPSTVIKDMHYDATHRILTIRFRPSGKRYDYFEIPAETYAGLKWSRSKGEFFNTHIRDRFPYREVEEQS
jgi:hypothetical protein